MRTASVVEFEEASFEADARARDDSPAKQPAVVCADARCPACRHPMTPKVGRSGVYWACGCE